MATLRSGVLGILAVAALMTAACTSAPAPSPTSAPSKPSAATPAASKPADSTAPSAKSSASDDSKAQWDQVVAAAKKEGVVTVAGGRGEPYTLAAMAFQKAYPDIRLEFSGVDGATFAPKIIAEREGGQYLTDIHMGGVNTAYATLIPKGVIDPIRPALLLPEVKDDSKWLGGIEGCLSDKGHQYVFNFEGRLSYAIWVNRDKVPESEINTPDQILDPKWKGKIIAMDPRIAGSAAQHTGLLFYKMGEDWYRKLLAQDLYIASQGRQSIEALARGTYPIALAVNAADIEQYRREGLVTNLKPLAPDSQATVAVTSGFGNLMLINKAPHPNAAKVFINWLLSVEGQKTYVENTGLNSRRLDVTGPAITTPKPGFTNLASEEFAPNITKAMAIAKEVLK